MISSLEEGRCSGILLDGPPGTGKTLLAISLAKEFNSSYYIIYGPLLSGNTKFIHTLTRAIKDANNSGICFVIINQINDVRESEQISLKSLLSVNYIKAHKFRGKSYFMKNKVSKEFEKYSLKESSKLVIIGTMNSGVIGSNKLQEAFADRFLGYFRITYPSKKKEVEIAVKLTGCKFDVAEIVVDAARELRKHAIRDLTITKIFSTRLVVNFCFIVSKMSPAYLIYNTESMIINRLGENIEEKKTIARILDGELFLENLRKYLVPKPDINSGLILTQSRPRAPEAKIAKNFRSKVEKYVFELGNGKYKNKYGSVTWKIFEWFWHHERRALREYIQLTEKMGYHKDYERSTGNSHLHNGEITLAYIEWLYRNRNKDLMDFMRRICPVL